MIKKLLIPLILAALILSGCSAIQIGISSIQGSGNVVSETRNVSEFTAISLEGSADVNVAFGTQDAVVVEAEDNILPLIETTVSNNQLVIRNKPGTTFLATKHILVSVTMKSLQGVTLAGSGNIDVPELAGDALKVELTGSGNITISGTANSVDITLAGSGNITVGGTANSVNITLKGSGNVYCDGLQAKTATVSMPGSGNITVYASQSLDATISGSGNIRYSGNPAKVNTKITGSGTIQK